MTQEKSCRMKKGCIPFKGQIHFRCYNLSKIDKYYMKTFKLVDSTNNNCLKFKLYVANDKTSTSEFRKTHDLAVRLLQEYIGKSYIIFMDNVYSSPYLFYELNKIQAGAVGTLHTTHKGVRKGIRDSVQKLCRI